MKLVSYLKEGQDQLAILVDGLLFDTDLMHPNLPVSMSMFLNYWEDVFPIALGINRIISEGKLSRLQGIPYEDVEVLAPVPHPTSCRDAYAFRQHVAAARRNRKVDMINEFDQYPVFYFTNHNSIQGPGEVVCMPDHFEKLDFELEAGIVICKPGKNIKAEEADEYIGGYMVMNDLSARRLQMEEMLLNLGPAKGKDFATTTGPMLVTPDELEPFKVDCKPGHTGNAYNLSMKCWVNDIQVSEGNLADMDWTFAEIIERASYGVQMFPGDIIGSGTVGTGCFLELNGTGKLNDPGYNEQWLKDGDVVEMEIENLGKLSNTIVKDESDFSILALKKNM
ncbi:MAG TPA: fumarylacetoacetate hydrolase family protein [Chitinophagaceae bacterium]|nr:fumarylacetoacetate hydrolase family protein [Chitinophagaceae bacterium]